MTEWVKIELRVTPAFLARIDRWVASLVIPPNRTAGLRVLIDRGLSMIEAPEDNHALRLCEVHKVIDCKRCPDG